MNCCYCRTPIVATDPSEKTVARVAQEAGVHLEGRICQKCYVRFRASPKVRGRDRPSVSNMGQRALAALTRKDYQNFISCAEEIDTALKQAERNVEKQLNELQRLAALRNHLFDFKNMVQHAMHTSPEGKYLARRLEANAKIAEEPLRLRIFSRDNFKCVNCESRYLLSIDHIKSVLNGGSDEDDNLQTLCGNCNSSKGSRSWEEFTKRYRVNRPCQ